MNVVEKINKMENCRGRNHDLHLFREWLDMYLPDHVKLKKIQIAGTNGKGSTSIWLRDLLCCKNLHVGVFTSPHLVSHTERIRIDDTLISLEDWERIYDQYVELFESKQMTMFEMDLWMAIAYFIEKKVDYCIMEAGMGGRLDATTALDYDACLITNVGMDHTEYLGDSFEKIAYEKAGIFKSGVLALTSEEKVECQKVIQDVADGLGVDLKILDCKETEILHLHDMDIHMCKPYYQAKNLKLALETLYALGYSFLESEIQSIVDHFQWSGRFMTLRKDPMILIDGAHNLHGIQALVHSLQDFKGNIYFSVLKEKDALDMIECLKSVSENITLVHFESDRLYPLETLGYRVIMMDELMDILKNTSVDSVLCGSLYFVGDVLERWTMT